MRVRQETRTIKSTLSTSLPSFLDVVNDLERLCTFSRLKGVNQRREWNAGKEVMNWKGKHDVERREEHGYVEKNTGKNEKLYLSMRLKHELSQREKNGFGNREKIFRAVASFMFGAWISHLSYQMSGKKARIKPFLTLRDASIFFLFASKRSNEVVCWSTWVE